MGQVDVLSILRSKNKNPLEFNYDNLWIPPIDNYLSAYDIRQLYDIATSISLSSNTEERYRLIKDIMYRNGFARFAAGTNRMVFRYYEDQRFVVKVATDKIGIEANLAEKWTQQLLAPYCAKTFYTSADGCVSFCERVQPINTRAEYLSIARLVYRMITTMIVGRLVIDDIGTDYFKNIGVRVGTGPVLLDYPYAYPLDGNLLYCNKILENGTVCDGLIDYDDGFNKLVCTKCGKRYFARDLRNKNTENMPIISKGGITNMKINIMRGDKVLFSSVTNSDVIRKPKEKRMEIPKTNMVVKVKKGDQYINLQQQQDIEKEENGCPSHIEDTSSQYNLKVVVKRGDTIINPRAEQEAVEIKDEIGLHDSVTITRTCEGTSVKLEDEKESINENEQLGTVGYVQETSTESIKEDKDEFTDKDEEIEQPIKEINQEDQETSRGEEEVEERDGKNYVDDYKDLEDEPTFQKIPVPRNREERRNFAKANRDKRDPAIRSNFNRNDRNGRNWR